MTLAVVSLCSTPRVTHLHAQLRALGGVPDLQRIVVWIGDDHPPALDADTVLRVPPGPAGLRLAAARNAGAAAAAGADLLIFLDADCVPGPELIRRYRAAAERHPEAVLCGPVTYLAEGVSASDPADLVALTSPHAARPMPPDDAERTAAADEYALFWSLSFALTPETWRRIGGFDEAYEGYGGEDTDFAFRMRARAVPLVWTGGAHAYHQYHPTSSPPWQHLDDILRNGALFADRWGEWPMTGWLTAFEQGGAVRKDADGWRRATVSADGVVR
ncbi:glycosyltransferase family 2 protein [Microbacterium oleivorans]|uniref:glycosyltransferase family 2 protein n=1 Tax=Microbacterium oleivorans TaxID=273677 RepID=UPI00203C8083|nr:galactosyltransferase-related protein [Microbacterium oleivorans]MCM3695297.1 galactosyltransferase-related protein [Microbacterium oleivorans]